MSDQSSESSCEWVVLNEDEEELVLDDNEQSLNLELSYEGISHAVSDSIRSSLSSEELEWHYEQYENYIPPNRPSFIQEVDSRGFDDTEDCQSEDSNVEDDIVNKWISTSDINEEEEIADVAPVSKIHTYKHKRNDHLNFILNLSLALVLASAVGLGIGHFLGWSHKCFKSTSIGHKAAESIELTPAVLFEQVNEGNGHSKDKNLPVLSESFPKSVPCKGFKSEGSSAPHDFYSTSMNSNIAIDSGLTESSLIMSSDVFEFKTQDELPSNNFSNPYILNTSPESDIKTKIDLNELSSLEAVVKKIYELKEISSINSDIDYLIEDEVNNIKLELRPRNDVKEQLSDGNNVAYGSEIPFLNENSNLFSENKLNNNEFDFLKGYFNREKVSNRENNFTNQLRKDLNEVVQSLAAVAVARLSDVNEKYPALIEETELIIKLFSDFQTAINTKITDIDNYVINNEYKDTSKFNHKYLQKMVYTLVDSVDYLMKVSFKTLSKDGRKINVHKFSNNISKVILNFNKKWEKNTRFWSESVQKFKAKQFREENFKKGKENKYWKNKPQFDKQSKKSFKYRNSMKS